MKNIEKKWTLFLIATFVTFFGIVNVLIKGTKANEVPVNSNFDDINFYKEIIDIYNENNGTSYDYTYNLSDEELATIEEVLLDGTLDEAVRSITSVKGIEKLINLVVLIIDDVSVTELDLSNNDKLESLSLIDIQLTKIDLSNNDMLENIIIMNEKNKIIDATLDLTDKLELIKLNLSGFELTELDLSNNNKLENITLYEVGFNQEIKMAVGDNYNLDNPIILPMESTLGELIWKSSNEDIVTIDENGVVTAYGDGDAEIYLSLGTNNLIVHTVTVSDSGDDDSEDEEDYSDFGKIDDERKLVYGIVPGTKYGEKIGDSQVFDKDGVEVEDFADRILRTGDKVRIVINGTEFNYTVSVLGDINGDGAANKEDILKIANHIITNEEITGDEYIASADINEDGKISLVDFVRLAKYIIDNGEL